MSDSKIIRAHSPALFSSNNKLIIKSTHRQYSSLQTISSKKNQIENCNSIHADQTKNVSKQNQKMLKLLYQTSQHHEQCVKTQKILEQNLNRKEKQLILLRELYDCEKFNFEQFKRFFQKRQNQWKDIVEILKKKIQKYKAKELNCTVKPNDEFLNSSEYQSQDKINRLNLDNRLNTQNKEQGNPLNQLELQSETQPFAYQFQNGQKYVKNSEELKGIKANILLFNPKKYKKLNSKLFQSNKQIQNRKTSLLSNQISENFSRKKDADIQSKSLNPDKSIKLAIEDIFQRSLRKTYMKYLINNQPITDIFKSVQMQKLKIANNSTKQRLKKTIKKIFVYDTENELNDLIKIIEQNVLNKHQILNGQLIFQFLEQKFNQLDKNLQSFLTNSKIKKDKSPHYIRKKIKNSKFTQFLQRQYYFKQNLQSENQTNSILKVKKSTSKIKQNLKQSNISQSGNLSINSHIDQKLRSSSKDSKKKKLDQSDSQASSKNFFQQNIYTKKKIFHPVLPKCLNFKNKSISNKDLKASKTIDNNNQKLQNSGNKPSKKSPNSKPLQQQTTRKSTKRIIQLRKPY